MTNNEGESIQLQIKHPFTHFLLYNDQKYPINFDNLKFLSNYFYERRNEIPENDDIYLASYDPDDNITNFSPDEVIEFIKYIQFKTIQVTNDNVATLHCFGRKYEIDQLIESTEDYINRHEEEVLLKLLKRKEFLRNTDFSFYEDKIASNFSAYANNEDIIGLDISTLYRILDKVSKKDSKELKSPTTKDFLMKVLDKHGRPASILFKYADTCAFDDETLADLLTNYSQKFDFEFITDSVLNAFLKMKKEHEKYIEETNKKIETIAKELQMQKSVNDEMKSTLEKERQKHEKTEEEETKQKYEAIARELQEQKNINDRMKKQLSKSQIKNRQFLSKQKVDKRSHDELCKELEQLKAQVASMSAAMKDQDDKRWEDSCDGCISICKYGENMIISNKANKYKLDDLVKYLIKEKDRHQQKRQTVDSFQEILFLKRRRVTTEDKKDSSSATEEDIFISNSMICVMHENGTLTSIELQNELNQFPCIYFDLQYPTPNFESIYSELIKLKRNLKNKVKISIFYEGKIDTDQRFHNNKEISMLRLGKSVRNITSSGNNGSFEGCSSLTSVSIPSSVTSIGSSAFRGCSSLTSVSIPSSVTSIGDYVFRECSSLTSVSIPSSVASIGYSAFSGCSSLTSVSIPSSVTFIRDFAFRECSSLTNVLIPSSVTSIGEGSFCECSSLTSVSIPSSVTSIGKGAFSKCSSLTSVSISSSVSSIGDYVFSGCSSLTSVSIPSSVTSIGSYVFSGCSSLTSVSIPSSVTSIGDYVFSGCSSLTSVSIPSSVASIGEGIFYGVTKLNDIKVIPFKEKKINYIENKFLVFKSDQASDIYDILVWVNPNNEMIKVPEFIKRIGKGAFIGCSSLTSVSIPSSVTSIGDYAFRGCSSLTSVSVPSSVTSIGDYSFEGCSSLTSVSVPSTLDIQNAGFNQNVKIR